MENVPRYNGENNASQVQEINPWEKMAQEARFAGNEKNEKNFYESSVEFTGDNFSKFRETLFNASSEDARKIVESRISLLEEKSDKVDKISPMRSDQHIHRGYISGDTAVIFESFIGSQYKLKDTEYLYDAAEYMLDNKEQIGNGRQFFEKVTGFINSYFGIPDMSKDRWATIESKTGFESIADDNEYWNAIDNIDISVFKGEQIAQCSERSAMAQNIMSLFGYETYYVMGDVSIDGQNEGHAYNIVADTKGQKCLVDYSVTSTIERNGQKWDIPTTQKIDDYDSFAAGGRLKTNSWQHTIQPDGKVEHRRMRALDYGIMQ